jgi:hypothetical protein
MVIKRTDIKDLTEEMNELFARWEKVIDQTLARDWPNHMHLSDPYITFQIGAYPDGVVNKVIREYQQAGWRVEKTSDQRDGDFIQFRKPIDKPSVFGDH